MVKVSPAQGMASRRVILPALAAMALLVLAGINYAAPRHTSVLLNRDGALLGKIGAAAPAKAGVAKDEAGKKAATYHGLKSGSSRDDLDSYFEAIPVYHVNAYHEMGKAESQTTSKVSAKAAQKELDSYFDAMPTDDVDAYHEAKAKYHGKKFETAESRKALKQYFNRKAVDLHSNFRHVSASDAVQDLVSYYDSIPTSKVNAFHESQMLIPVAAKKKEEGAKQAFKDLSSYYDSIPTHNVNAFHERAAHAHTPPRDYDANKAFSDLSSYFSSVPTHHVNAFHESPSALAAEGVEKEEEEKKEERQEEAEARKAERVSAQVHKALAASDDSTEAKAARVQQAVHAQLTSIDAEEERTHEEEEEERRSASASASKKVEGGEGKKKEFKTELGKEMTLGLGLKGKAEADADAQRKEEEEERQQVRAHDVANINDDFGPDPDAPTGTEEQRHAEGYDTQYGLTKKLAGEVTIEHTPSGPVTSVLTTDASEAAKEKAQRALKAEAEEEERKARLEAWMRRTAKLEAEQHERLEAIRASQRAKHAQARKHQQQAMERHAENRRRAQAVAAGAEQDWSNLAKAPKKAVVPGAFSGAPPKMAAARANRAAAAAKMAAGEGMKVAKGQQMAALPQSAGDHSLARKLGQTAAPLLCQYAGLGCSWV